MRHPINAIRLTSAALAAIAVSAAVGSAGAQEVATVADRGDNVVVEVHTLPPVITSASAAPRWTGRVEGQSSGQITLTLDRVGMPSDPLDPVWPITAHWDFASDRDGRSFTAQLYGTARESGAMHLRGVIIEGYRQGSEVELTVTRVGGGAKLVIYPLEPR